MELDLIRIRDPKRPGIDGEYFDLNDLKDRGMVNKHGNRLKFQEFAGFDGNVAVAADVEYYPTGLLVATERERIAEVWMPVEDCLRG